MIRSPHAPSTAKTLSQSKLSRRAVLGLVLAATVPPLRAFARAHAAARNLSFVNTHTGESLTATYFHDGLYDSAGLRSINRILRDHRTGEVHPIAPGLLDLLYTLHETTRSKKPFQVISGYRSRTATRRRKRKFSPNSG